MKHCIYIEASTLCCIFGSAALYLRAADLVDRPEAASVEGADHQTEEAHHGDPAVQGVQISR